MRRTLRRFATTSGTYTSSNRRATGARGTITSYRRAGNSQSYAFRNVGGVGGSGGSGG